MSVENENVVAPNWLKELEEKRERRLIARLGHETGAGAPCITCKENCPGLDLHFWRKICKICKCAKEDHDVPDDDIYGWAQFQLLGSKPNKSRKIKLPGKKDEVELEWTPKGHNEVVDKFLRTLPQELLPVKGSPAAQERKQLLQKQIPVHDVDPTLCHELTAAELKQMNEYIAHVKQHSVGVGQVIQLGLNKASLHTIGAVEAHVLSNRLPTQVPNLQTVQLQGADSAKCLPKQLQSLNIDPKANKNTRNLPNYNPNTVDCFEQNQMPIKDQLVNIYRDQNTNYSKPEDIEQLDNKKNMPHYATGKFNTYTNQQSPQKIGNIRDLAFSTYDIKDLESSKPDLNSNKLPPLYKPSEIKPFETVQNPSQINVGPINDLTFAITEIKQAEQKTNEIFNPMPVQSFYPNPSATASCHRCKKTFEEDAIVIGIDHSDALFHSTCFKCKGCNQNLADLLYFYDKESDDIYCGRDYAKIRGIPRCRACDELIFVKEYCLAENATFHVKHFCCFECDMPLAGQNYLMEDYQPLCIPCYNKNKAQTCCSCKNVIKPDETGVVLKDLHFHASDECFSCKRCRVPLLQSKFLLRNERLFCSATCFNAEQAV